METVHSGFLGNTTDVLKKRDAAFAELDKEVARTATPKIEFVPVKPIGIPTRPVPSLLTKKSEPQKAGAMVVYPQTPPAEEKAETWNRSGFTEPTEEKAANNSNMLLYGGILAAVLIGGYLYWRS